MANQILAGAVVNAGMVIAGVDADNPPVTGPAPETQYHLLGADGPVHIEGDFSIVQDGFTSWTFEVEFTAPNDNQYRNIFTLGGTPDKKYGGLSMYTTNGGDAVSMVTSSSGTTTDGYNNFLFGANSNGWTGSPHRLTIVRDGNLGRTAVFKDGEFVSTAQAGAHPTHSTSVKWPATHFEGADLTFFAYADDSVIMGDGTGVEIHGWNYSKTNTYEDQGVTGLGGTITNLLPLTQTAPETPNPYVDPYAGDFIMASPSGRAITHNGGWDAIDMLQWISYGTWGESGTRSINTPGGASAIHHMRYDPVSKKVFALFTGGEATLADNGFGGYSTSNNDHFFSGYFYNNVTWANPTMGVVGSRNQYEPEDIPGLGISWNGTSWSMETNTVEFSQADNDQQYDVINEFTTLTRAANKGIYNSVLESEYDNEDYVSPAGTLWAVAPSGTYDPNTLTFTRFEDVYEGSIGSNILESNFSPVVMLCMRSREFYEFTFTAWTQGGGGGMAYTRTKLDSTWDRYGYPILATSGNAPYTDPTASYWRENYAPAGYTWIPYVGFTSTEPLTSTRSMFEGMDIEYLNITHLDMSQVNRTSSMFEECSGMDVTPSDLSGWDVSNVEIAYEMFKYTSFNQDISGWDTSNMTDMEGFFYSATEFNQPIGNWNTSSVTNFHSMFYDAQSFNQDIGGWDTSSATNMAYMFEDAPSFNNGGSPSINNWDTSNVTDMDRLFYRTPFNQPIGNWNTSNVIDMSEMFEENEVFDQNIGDWDVSSVEEFDEMFQDATAFNNGGSASIGTWDVSSCTDFGEMFENAESFNQDLSSWVVAQSEEHGQFDKGCTSWTLPRPNFPGGISSSDD